MKVTDVVVPFVENEEFEFKLFLANLYREAHSLRNPRQILHWHIFTFPLYDEEEDPISFSSLFHIISFWFPCSVFWTFPHASLFLFSHRDSFMSIQLVFEDLASLALNIFGEIETQWLRWSLLFVENVHEVVPKWRKHSNPLILMLSSYHGLLHLKVRFSNSTVLSMCLTCLVICFYKYRQLLRPKIIQLVLPR